MGGDDEKWEGILARVREGVLEKVAFGKSRPKLGRQMDTQTWGDLATKGRQMNLVPERYQEPERGEGRDGAAFSSNSLH